MGVDLRLQCSNLRVPQKPRLFRQLFFDILIRQRNAGNGVCNVKKFTQGLRLCVCRVFHGTQDRRHRTVIPDGEEQRQQNGGQQNRQPARQQVVIQGEEAV